MNSKSIAKLVLCILACQAAGIFGSIFTIPSIPTWYAGLQKPFFSPPNWLFGPAWVTLYLLMGAALYLVLSKGAGKQLKIATAVFAVQLALNAAWSFLFFGMQSPFLGFAEIIILWIAIALAIFEFKKVSKKAALLLLPYIAWVTFAAILNFSIWQLNL